MAKIKKSSNQKIKRHPLASVLLSLFMLSGVMLITTFASTDWSAVSANVLRTKKTLKSGSPVTRRLTETFRKSAAEMESESSDPKESCKSPATENPLYQGEFLTKELTVKTAPKEEFKVSVYIKNTGNMPWFGDTSNCYPLIRLGTSRERDRHSRFAYTTTEHDTGWHQTNRVMMTEKRVEPGEVATFTFLSRASYGADTYREYFQPVIEGKSWMERPEETVRVDIAVGNTDPLDVDRLKYINKSGAASLIKDPNAPREIHVDISDQKMHVTVDGVKIREYPVSTGTFKMPTPLGKGKIVGKQDLRIASKYPHYRMPQWQSLAFEKHKNKFLGFGFHSLPYLANDKGVFWTEALNHIGQRVSHGCIRLLPEDAQDLYAMTQPGDQFEITN